MSPGRRSDRSAAPASPPEPGLVMALLDWFDRRERDVPWRDESDPYRIWVGEVMAQQTRIDTVRRYYADFLEVFPDVGSLAAAPLDAVLKAWEGLGYYARARNLHRAAARVVAEHGGRLPDDVGSLRALPGIGRYTAAAVASLAFGRAEPAVDGNVRRVLSRLLDEPEPGPGRLENALRGWIGQRPRRAADLNQAVMDLGEAVCTPRAPACDRCPLAGGCLALARGTVGERPRPRRRGPRPHRDVAVGLVRDARGRVLIQRRPPEGLLGGLWEFPGGKVEPEETPAETVRRELREELGIEVRPGDLLARVEHAYSHFRITLHAHEAELLEGTPRPREATAWTWAEVPRLGEYAFPAATLRVIEALAPGARRALCGRRPD